MGHTGLGSPSHVQHIPEADMQQFYNEPAPEVSSELELKQLEEVWQPYHGGSSPVEIG